MSVIVCDNVENNSDFECCDKSFPLGVNEGYQLGENDISSARNIAKLVSSTVAKECVVLPENSELNFDNCSGVIIGPVTQFHGPVNVFPSAVNGNVSCGNGLPASVKKETLDTTKLAKTESSSLDIYPSNEKFFISKNLIIPKHLKLLCVACILVLTAIVLTVYFVLPSKPSHESPNDNTTEPPVIPGPGKHYMYYRDYWGGEPPLNFTRPLSHPVPLVIIIHTATPMCKDLDTCSDRMRSIQSYHVQTFRSPDIGYNFLIGGDGNIYVGRGWDTKNFSQDDSITIAFIGNFVYYILTPSMIEACKNLLDEGLKLGKLDEHYTLVAHNQTFVTDSPGENVYRVIKDWPHFKPGWIG